MPAASTNLTSTVAGPGDTSWWKTIVAETVTETVDELGVTVSGHDIITGRRTRAHHAAVPQLISIWLNHRIHPLYPDGIPTTITSNGRVKIGWTQPPHLFLRLYSHDLVSVIDTNLADASQPPIRQRLYNNRYGPVPVNFDTHAITIEASRIVSQTTVHLDASDVLAACDHTWLLPRWNVAAIDFAATVADTRPHDTNKLVAPAEGARTLITALDQIDTDIIDTGFARSYVTNLPANANIHTPAGKRELVDTITVIWDT